MNPHFDSGREAGQLPTSVYARVDSAERDGENRLLLSFSAVSCESVKRALPDLSEADWAREWNGFYPEITDGCERADNF